METLQLLGSALGFGLLAGIRLYATVLALGLAIRFGLWEPDPAMSHLRVLADPMVLAAAAVAFVLEFISDKVPWVDSLWDSVHTFIRPLGAAILGATAFGSMDPALRLTLIIVCGGVAFASHSSKAATRLVVNHSPEPFTNIGLSIVEDLFIPFGIWLSLKHPILTFGFVAVFLAIFLWVSPKIFRLMKLQLLALGALISNALRASSSQPRRLPSGDQGVPALLAALRRAMERLPERYARVAVEKCGSTKVAEGLKCAAGKSIRSLRNSVGYLLLCNDEVVFLTQRNFRYRIHRIGISEIRDAQWRRGILLHRLILKTADGESTFYVFR